VSVTVLLLAIGHRGNGRCGTRERPAVGTLVTVVGRKESDVGMVARLFPDLGGAGMPGPRVGHIIIYSSSVSR